MMWARRRRALVALTSVAIMALASIARVRAGEDEYVRAGALLDKGAYAEAVVAYERLLGADDELDDARRSRVLNNLGFAHYKLGKRRVALEYYRRALEIDPVYVTCLNNVAAVLMNERRFAEALTYLDRAYKQGATVKVVFNLFVTHYYMGDRERALSFVEEALRLDERYTESRLKAKDIKQRDIDRLKRRVK